MQKPNSIGSEENGKYDRVKTVGVGCVKENSADRKEGDKDEL